MTEGGIADSELVFSILGSLYLGGAWISPDEYRICIFTVDNKV